MCIVGGGHASQHTTLDISSNDWCKKDPGVSIANEARRHLVFRIMACDTHPSPSNICPRQGQREVGEGEERQVDEGKMGEIKKEERGHRYPKHEAFTFGVL